MSVSLGPLRRSHVTRAHEPTVHIDFDIHGELDAFLDRFHLTFNPHFFADLVKRAAAETILAAVRKRFIQNLPNALEMVVIHDTLGEVANQRQRKTKEMDRWNELVAEVSTAQQSGDPAKVAAAQHKLMAFRKDMLRSLNRSPNGTEHHPTWSSLSSGKFRARALEVLNKLTNMDQVRVTNGEGGLTVSFGDVTELDTVRTPSAVQYVFHRGPTRSPYDILWRHLEFGTGFYSRDPEGQNHPNRPMRTSSHNPASLSAALSGGYWRFPTGKAGAPYSSSIILKGSKGVHALKSASGVMYDEDAVRFQAVLAAMIWNSLGGGALAA